MRVASGIDKVRVAFRILLVLEALRLLAWLLFLGWLFLTYDAATWIGPEASIASILASAYLGFPYSWLALVIAGTWDFLPVSEHIPIRIAVSHFVLWLAVTVAGLGYVRRIETKSGKP